MDVWRSDLTRWSAKPVFVGLIPTTSSNLITMRNKNRFLTNAFRRIKHFPYGGKKFTGYGGEIYSRDPNTKRFTETCGIIVNKSRERFRSKLELKDELLRV